MADDYLALADLAVINNGNLSGIQVSSLFDDAPALQVLPAVAATNGHLHYYLDLTQNPVVNFRVMNEGREHDHSIDTLRTVTCEIMDASFTVDVAATQIWKGGAEDLLSREAMRHLRQAMFKVEQQWFEGTINAEAGGFLGLANKHTALSAAYTDGAGGAGGSSTSVYIVRANPDECAVVAGQGGVIEIGEASVNRIAGASVGWLPAWHVPIVAWYGCQHGALATSSYRLANLDATHTLTDAMIYTGLSAFPASRPPNFIFMNRRALGWLRAARTATNSTGAPAPYPTEVEGVRIVVTDALIDTEAAVT